MNYQEYINSEAWAKRRIVAKIAAGYKCQKCGFEYELDVHHLTYENLGHEKAEDLLVLCRRCHRDIHYFEQHTIPVIDDVVTELEYEQKKKQFMVVLGYHV
ncbi:MAG: hypothetical protein K1000chlam4_00929 [Chlamydiae bacterium]|nr:hypothetical protein [Chlamydiota bacterium]